MSDQPAIPAQQMRLVLEVSRQLAVTTQLDPLLELICRSANSLLEAERCSIFLYDRTRDELWTKVAMGASEIRVPAGAGIVGLVFRSQEIVNIPDAYADDRFNRSVDQKTGFRTRNLLTAPMFDAGGKPVGVLQAVNKRQQDGFFDAADEMLCQLLADQAGVAIQRYHLQQTAIQTVELRREMELAKRVQQAMIPKRCPQLPGIETAGWTRPASTTGGDAFDLWTLPDGRLALFLADASGHGLGPALVVSQARTLARSLSTIDPTPCKVLGHVNARLADDLDDGMFVTAFFAVISPDGTIQWSSAGQGPVLCRTGGITRSAGTAVELDDAGQDVDGFEELMAPAPPLGVVPFFPDEECPTIQLEIGGMLVVCTDGIFEAFSPDKSQYGVTRVRSMLSRQGLAQAPLAEVVATLRDDVHDWQAGGEPTDDQTIVLVRRSNN